MGDGSFAGLVPCTSFISRKGADEDEDEDEEEEDDDDDDEDDEEEEDEEEEEEEEEEDDDDDDDHFFGVFLSNSMLDFSTHGLQSTLEMPVVKFF